MRVRVGCSLSVFTRVGAHASHGSKIKDLVGLLDILHAHNPLIHAHACTLHPHPMPACMSIHACTYQGVRTQTFCIEGWQGGAPATGPALAGGLHPHTCMFQGTEHPRTYEHCSLHPSLYPPHPPDHLCPCPHHRLCHSCPLHLHLHPMPPSVHISSPHAHTPCTIHIDAPTIHTCGGQRCCGGGCSSFIIIALSLCLTSPCPVCCLSLSAAFQIE